MRKKSSPLIAPSTPAPQFGMTVERFCSEIIASSSRSLLCTPIYAKRMELSSFCVIIDVRSCSYCGESSIGIYKCLPQVRSRHTTSLLWVHYYPRRHLASHLKALILKSITKNMALRKVFYLYHLLCLNFRMLQTTI
jgi:hypothetical protein